MSLFSITAKEWIIAKHHLANQPNGTKLKHSKLPSDFNPKHSFIKINGKIYGLTNRAAKDPSIKAGSMSKTKYAQDERGNLYVVKIDPSNTPVKSADEGVISLDLDLGKGVDIRRDKPKRYLVLRYLGRDLKSVLADNSVYLTEDARLDIAIQLAYQVYSLHIGLLSKSQKGYAHKDIKHDNIVIDKQGKIHLIDFGLAQNNPQANSKVVTEANYFTAFSGVQKLTGIIIDVVAVKRCLFLPRTFYCNNMYFEVNSTDYYNHNSILNQNILDKYYLNEFINTHSVRGNYPVYANQIMDSVIICAALINARLQLGISAHDLKSNLLLCHALVGAYFAKFSPIVIKEVISGATSYKLIGILHFHNSMDKFNEYSQDELFLFKISKCISIEEATSLLKLKKQNQTNHYDLVEQSPETKQVLVYLAKVNRTDLISHFIKNHSPELVNAILLFETHNCTNRLEALITNPDFLAAITTFLNRKDPSTLIHIASLSDITDKNLIIFCQDKTKQTAVEIMINRNHLYKAESINTILQEREIAIAINNFNQFKFLDSDLRELVRSKDKCRAFNILIDNKIMTQRAKDAVIYSNTVCEKIFALHNLKMDDCIPLLFKIDLDQDQLEILLKSRYFKEITQEMLLNESMRSALIDCSGNEDQLLALITLHKKQLTNEGLLQRFKLNASILKQISKLIKDGQASLLDKHSLQFPFSSLAEFMLKLVSKKYTALASAGPELTNQTNFMLAAMKINVKALEFASADLRSKHAFIAQAMQVNYQAFQYASDAIKSNPQIKLDMKRSLLHYQFTSKNMSRFHLFSANLKKHDDLRVKYKNKTGDALKTAILKQFKRSLEGKNSDEIDTVVTAFKESSEYTILRTSQGLFSTLFRINTTSCHSVERIIDDARNMANSAGLTI